MNVVSLTGRTTGNIELKKQVTTIMCHHLLWQ